MLKWSILSNIDQKEKCRQDVHDVLNSIIIDHKHVNYKNGSSYQEYYMVELLVKLHGLQICNQHFVLVHELTFGIHD